MNEPLPDILPIEPAAGPISGTVRVPGSKSFTNRAYIVAALARGQSRLTGVLDSEDTEVMRDSLAKLGIAVEHDEKAHTSLIAGCGGDIPAPVASLFLANSGTSIRFLAAMVALGHGEYRLDGIERMRKRPIGDLLTALRQWGVDAKAENDDDCPPAIIKSQGLSGGEVSVRGDVSSQFLSALLMVAPLAKGPTTIAVEGPLVSKPYLDMTLSVMEAFGASCEQTGYERFHFAGSGIYQGRDYAIEPDASAASYFFAVAAITGGTVTVEGLGKESLQGDLGIVDEFERMGCRVDKQADRTTVTGGPLQGIDVDLCHLSDMTPTLAVVACLAKGPTRIRNVAHIRHKETDRVAALVTELRKTGATVNEYPDGLEIHPLPQPCGADFATYNDHRMAMALALVGLRTPGVRILDPSCVRKTYPAFFADLARLRRQ